MSAQHIIVKRMTKLKKSFSLSDTKRFPGTFGQKLVQGKPVIRKLIYIKQEESGYLHLQNEEGHQFEIGAPPCSVDALKFLNHWE